jgi:hypothetical protein
LYIRARRAANAARSVRVDGAPPSQSFECAVMKPNLLQMDAAKKKKSTPRAGTPDKFRGLDMHQLF